MSLDITHCSGEGCPISTMCKRNDYFRKIENYGVKNYGMNTSFFSVPPYDSKKGDCEMFWGEQSDIIFHQLQKILGVKIKRVPYSKLKWKKKKKELWKKIGYKLKKKS